MACFFLCFTLILPVKASEQSRLAELEAKVEGLVAQQEESDSVIEDTLNRVEITGYVSLRGGQISEKGFSYLGAVEGDWSFSNESTYGIQIKAPLYDRASALLQFSGNSLEGQADVDWAFLGYEISPKLTLRGGRLRVPGFMMSEYREVGYAYPWVQTPLEVYGFTPFLRYEGLDLRYFLTFGDVDIRINPFVGSTRNQDLSLGNIKYAEQDSQFGGIDIQLNYGNITVRVSHSRYDFNITQATWDSGMEAFIDGVTIVPGDPEVRLSGLLDVLDLMIGAAIDSAYVAEAASLTSQKNNYRNDSTMGGAQEAEYTSIGVSYDSEDWLVLAEYTRGGIDGAFPDAKGGYVTVGYRIGNWMPHITYASLETYDDDEREALPELEVTDSLWTGPESAAVLGVANSLIGHVNDTRNLSNTKQRSGIFGVRWDPVPGIALKVEYQRIELPGESYGYILPESIVDGAGNVNASPEFLEKADDVRVIKLSLDLVF